ncbi:zinc finger Y-chromosomal protein-like [Anthonomus grandis grandis]|uniref:zinc finger Y-chromosomal protein-like n=1 Tax=Anthonomus grandis grandis TaxID=2921223 RepID=UPI002165C0F1|nr:zinc finger Y-chromosomal protein-like [Anthonomus grandis grandis]
MSARDVEETAELQPEEEVGEEEEDHHKQQQEQDNTENNCNEIFSCLYCEYETEILDELDEHFFSHDEALHEESLIEAERGIVPTEEEDIPEVNELSLRFHEEQAKLIKSYIFVCPYEECEYETDKRKTMSRHFLIHCVSPEVFLYSCSQCFYTTRRRNDMPKHLLTHCKKSEALLFGCPECLYTTKRKGDLRAHLICHSKSLDDLVTCHVCGYTCRRISDLRKHMIVHKSEEDRERAAFNCTKCGYSSKRLNDLNKHVILHSDRNVKGVLKCLNCPYTTTDNSIFAKHILNLCNYVENGAAILDNADQQYVVLDEDNFALFNSAYNEEGACLAESDTVFVNQKSSQTTTRIKSHLKRTRDEQESEPSEAGKVLVLTRFNEGQENVIV